ncbi:MAG: Hsp20/alpha crystallin family protein [Chthonomonas sp.]|nr:Hsp20/alpha crystallin family protein [Chthonomonas sp.]
MRRKDLDQWLWQVGLELQQQGHEGPVGSARLAQGAGWQPRVDVLAGKGGILIKVELAGVSEDDLKLTYDTQENILIVRGTRRENERLTESLRPHILEIPHGEFERRIAIPTARLVPTTIEAALDHGLLIVWGRQAEPETIAESSPIRRRVVLIQRIEREL